MKVDEIKALAKRFQGYADASNVAGFITPEVDEVARILPRLIKGYESYLNDPYAHCFEHNMFIYREKIDRYGEGMASDGFRYGCLEAYNQVDFVTSMARRGITDYEVCHVATKDCSVRHLVQESNQESRMVAFRSFGATDLSAVEPDFEEF